MLVFKYFKAKIVALIRCSLGEEASLFCGSEEPVLELFEGDLAVAVFVKLGEGLIEGSLVE